MPKTKDKLTPGQGVYILKDDDRHDQYATIDEDLGDGYYRVWFNSGAQEVYHEDELEHDGLPF